MRVIIVGLGGVGTMAAWRLAEAGHQVIGLEQFRLDHDRGSSYGDSRIVRRVYADTLYTALMADAYALWDELQARFPDQELIQRSGGLFFGPRDDPRMQVAEQALAESRVAHELLSSGECHKRFPAFVLREDEVAVFEPSMGFARASRCVLAAARLARQRGADLREEVALDRIETTGAGVRVTLKSGEVVEADRLLLCAGAWVNRLLQPFGLRLPLAVSRQAYVHLEPERNADQFEAGRFPTWIDVGENLYGFPRLGDVPGVKLATHTQGEKVTPDNVERDVTEADAAEARAYAARRFPDLSHRVVYSKVCLYSNTPDEDFIIDAVPGAKHVWVISACSGHGFKFTPLVGQIAADLAADNPINYNLARFRLARFAAA